MSNKPASINFFCSKMNKSTDHDDIIFDIVKNALLNNMIHSDNFQSFTRKKEWFQKILKISKQHLYLKPVTLLM